MRVRLQPEHAAASALQAPASANDVPIRRDNLIGRLDGRINRSKLRFGCSQWRRRSICSLTTQAGDVLLKSSPFVSSDSAAVKRERLEEIRILRNCE